MVTEALRPPCQLLVAVLKIEVGVVEVGSEPRNGSAKGPLSVP